LSASDLKLLTIEFIFFPSEDWVF